MSAAETEISWPVDKDDYELHEVIGETFSCCILCFFSCSVVHVL